MDLNVLMSAKRFAVVGASADEHKVGHQILRNLHSNPNLTVYPINLKGGTILDLPVYGHLWETPDPAEVVIISVPVLTTEAVVDACVRIGANVVVLISSGFAEAGIQGKVLQERILSKLHAAGIALLGPNTMGYISPDQGIYASFGPNDIGAGPIAIISQSGAMLSALFGEYSSARTGVSLAISLGNATGINENDTLSYAANDSATKVIAIYLESLKDPKALLSIAKELSTKKPIFLLKGGVTEEGRSAAVSHTAALATSQVLLDDLCLQAGIVQVANFEDLVRSTVAAAKATFLPENIMIVTNAGGPAVVLIDEIAGAGIPLASLTPGTIQALSTNLPGLRISNPLDLLGDASPSDYQASLKILSQDVSIDAVVAVVTEQAVTDIDGLTRSLSRPYGKHLLFACLAGGDELDIYRQKLKDAGVIVTRYPNEIAETLSSLARAKKRLGKKIELEIMDDKIVNEYPETYLKLTTLLEKYGIASPKEILISSEKEITKVESIGWPVIAKTTDLKLLHKAKIEAVIQDIMTIDQAKVALTKLQQWDPLVVFEEKIKEGIEVLIGAHKDLLWGWYMAVGMGGSLSDTYDDRSYIFLPATKPEMMAAVSRTKLAKLLNPDSTTNLVNAMYKLQECVFTTKNLREIEINPLFVSDKKVIAADLKRA